MQVLNWISNLLTGGFSLTTTGETITVGDRDRKAQVVLDPNLPDDAYEQLFHLDLSGGQSVTYVWDHHARGWRVCV